MASILDRIPAPQRQYERPAAEPSPAAKLASRALKEPPAYGKRTGFVPRRVEDYGDGEGRALQPGGAPFAVMRRPASLQQPRSGGVLPEQNDSPGSRLLGAPPPPTTAAAATAASPRCPLLPLPLLLKLRAVPLPCAGGAFPEIHVAQYPLDMGRPDSGKGGGAGGGGGTLALTVNAGKLFY